MAYKGAYEKVKHATEQVPYTYYKSKIPENVLSVPPHWHREFEINFVREGSAVFRVGEKEYEAGAGDILLIQPDAVHYIYSREGFCIYDTLVFSMDMLGGGADRANREHIAQIRDGRIEILPIVRKSDACYQSFCTCIENIFTYATRSALDDIMVKSHLLEMIYLLIQKGYTALSDIQTVKKTLKPILEYIAEHVGEEMNIRDLAGLAHLSESYFMAQFKKQTGMSAVEYIHKLRIEMAQEMLRNGDLSVLQIAGECGFKNISNFNRCFKKHTGKTPLAYKNR